MSRRMLVRALTHPSLPTPPHPPQPMQTLWRHHPKLEVWRRSPLLSRGPFLRRGLRFTGSSLPELGGRRSSFLTLSRVSRSRGRDDKVSETAAHRIQLWDALRKDITADRSSAGVIRTAETPQTEPAFTDALNRAGVEILGQALLQQYPGLEIHLLSWSPTSVQDGRFYLDFAIFDPETRAPVTVPATDLPEIQKHGKRLLKSKSGRFDLLQVPVSEALPFFQDSQLFRSETLRRSLSAAPDPQDTAGGGGGMEEGMEEELRGNGVGSATLVRCGPHIDLLQPPLEFPDLPSSAAALRAQELRFAEDPKHLLHILPETVKSLGVLAVLSCSGLEQTLSLPDPGTGGIMEWPVQRIYAAAFPDRASHAAWTALRAEQMKRDHRILGQRLKLFMTHEVSPGGTFWLPHGTRLYNRIQEKLRTEYRRRGYDEVRTPLLYHRKLWEQSGHWENYRENMFRVVGGKSAQNLSSSSSPAAAAETSSNDLETEHGGSVMGLKPMNCPGHCLIYAAEKRSFRHLPLRMADFSALHRDEESGALSGLTRVTRFHQDDAHIFCRPDQIQSEILKCLEFIRDIYASCGLDDWSIALSTRPEKFVGEIREWDEAETALENALRAFMQRLQASSMEEEDDGDDGDASPEGNHSPEKKMKKKMKKNGSNATWFVKEGDGAFYGPKLDIHIKDALGRSHQCGTVQLDFQLPRRFDLRYTPPRAEDDDNTTAAAAAATAGEGEGEEAREKKEGTEEPYVVMVHRAILGSVERFIAVLLEHHAGRLPLWLSPRQVLVLPIRGDSETQLQYAKSVTETLAREGFYTDLQVQGTLNRRLRNGTELAYNYLVILGDREVEQGVVEVRPLREADSQRQQTSSSSSSSSEEEEEEERKKMKGLGKKSPTFSRIQEGPRSLQEFITELRAEIDAAHEIVGASSSN